MEEDRVQLAQSVEQELLRYFAKVPLVGSLQGQPWGLTTKAIKDLLRDLGHQRGFSVCASGCAGAEPGWLYDVVWYESKDGYMTRQVLVAECELQSPDPPVDGDFQKLVQARADVRLWISCPKSAEIGAEHLRNCKRQAELFSGAAAGDTYIFVTEDWVNQQPSIERFVIGDAAPLGQP